MGKGCYGNGCIRPLREFPRADESTKIEQGLGRER